MNAPLRPFSGIQIALSAHAPERVEDPELARAAVALILAPASDGHELLVIRRAVREGDPWSGQMALPGGRYEPGDRSLLETAMRETREETGVMLHGGNRLGELNDLAPKTPALPPIAVRPFVFGVERKPEVTLNPEADRYFWVPLEGLKASRIRARVAVRGHHLLVDAFQVESEVIWGMTERIIMPFLDLVND